MSLFFLFLSLFSFLQKTAACRLLPLIFQCEIIAGRGICVHKSNAVNSHEFPSALLEKVTLEKVDFEFQSSDKANIYIAFSTLREGEAVSSFGISQVSSYVSSPSLYFWLPSNWFCFLFMICSTRCLNRLLLMKFHFAQPGLYTPNQLMEWAPNSHF